MGEFRGLPAAGLACLATTLVVMGGPPAAAQASFEFGYKDRIFKQQYVLPEEIPASRLNEVALALVAIAMANPTTATVVTDPNVLRRQLQGECGVILLRRLAPGPMTDAQRALAKMPDALDPMPDRLIKVTCNAQVLYFVAASADPASTDRQLDDLARYIPERFRDDWVMIDRIQDARLLPSLKKFATLWFRADLLKRKGVSGAADILSELESGPFSLRLSKFADAEGYDPVDARLTSLENDAVQRLPRLQAEDAASRKEREQAAYAARLLREADDAVARAEGYLKGKTEEYENAAMRARLNPDPTSTAARVAAFLEDQVTRAKADLKGVIADRETLKAHLAQVANGTPATPAQPQAQAQPGDPSMCFAGERCSILSKTIFCETLGQMQAVLAKPAGPQRRKLLHDLMARRVCLVLEPGTLLYPHGDLLTVTPIGEAPTKAVAAKLETGREGFVLESAVGSHQTASR
ncbi:MAG: hypothetical protein H2042_10970 [Rhizobiales bacterium]|uniref:hypothetical protein n=1 Tax=Aquabacter cavernae TaxID=2496029 RepID=UPI000F8DEEF0|nr:hypothetical protein [Aquabacter cavernae]MBA4790208.1 hypothetical protein [Hyphomicrobiales bacterium]